MPLFSHPLPTSSKPRGRPPERGVAALELALILPMLVMLLLGLLDYGKYLFVSLNATEAAREGARKLSQTAVGNCAQTAATTATTTAQGSSGAVKLFMAQVGLDTQTTVTVTCQTTPVNPTWLVQVQVDYQPTIGYMTAKGLMPKGTGTTARVKARLAMRGY